MAQFIAHLLFSRVSNFLAGLLGSVPQLLAHAKSYHQLIKQTIPLFDFHPKGEGKRGMKETELKLVSELMKNSRRSDRELARAMGVSQPTVSRMIRKLEKEARAPTIF